MQRYFDILFEFDQNKFNGIITDSIEQKKKGYICVVDGNVLAETVRSASYKEIINNALVNSCDGGSIAKIAGVIHKQKLQTYTGPELFSIFVNKNYKQIFLGNTDDVLNRLKAKMISEGLDSNKMQFKALPFKDVNQFDYISIAKNINTFTPDLIWISLGAPKQEVFISKLLPHIESGILVAIGAAFNLHLNDKEYKRAPKWVRKINMEWMYRSIKEPKRVGKRAFKYVKVIPRLIFNEINL
jgi:N-acetylglucosaminyldiphosphoundecaprenol N-acetyl-beta-D-mannosaminyltransferase